MSENSFMAMIRKNPVTTGIVSFAVLSILIIVIVMMMKKNNTPKPTTKEGFSFSDTFSLSNMTDEDADHIGLGGGYENEEIVENFPQPAPMNVMYSDANGNLATTTDLGVEYISVTRDSAVSGNSTVSGNLAVKGNSDLKGNLTVNGNSSVSGNMNSGGSILSNKNLQTNRNRVCFSSAVDDPNHSIYNNYTNIDGEGGWDGIKMNTYAGLDVRTGNASGAVPVTRLSVKDTGISVNGNISSTGNISAGGALSSGSISTGGGLSAGSISTGGDLLANRMTVGGPMSSGVVNIKNPDGNYTHFGWVDNKNYIRGDTQLDGNLTVKGQLALDNGQGNRFTFTLDKDVTNGDRMVIRNSAGQDLLHLYQKTPAKWEDFNPANDNLPPSIFPTYDGRYPNRSILNIRDYGIVNSTNGCGNQSAYQRLGCNWSNHKYIWQ